ncbi:MAG: 3-phosphoserine/phosphohydroxythreonine transaminase [Sphingobacteriales bacterium]|nr:MAG: 3-phosphoserine/phosphohydroxythreonine transaminase [Sphingobacteriales bacterium]
MKKKHMTNSTGKSDYYFGSGPASLPAEVLQEAAAAIMDYQRSGLSILSIPHRGKAFGQILEEANALVRELCGIGDEFEILWLQGGGRLQFTMVPMNFLPEDGVAGYVDSGHWAHEAERAARYFGQTDIVCSSAGQKYCRLPALPENLNPDLSYLHITTNNTIYGTQWQAIPRFDVPVVADMSSDIFSMHRNYSSFSMFYACVQKNIGPAGVTMVAVRKDQLERTVRETPEMLSYTVHAANKSVLNTPPVFAIFTSLLMLRWTKKQTVAALQQESIRKSAALYEEIEQNSMFTANIAEPAHRSRMNVCFRTVCSDMEQPFINKCMEEGITGIEGHRSAGGFRASLYNAVPFSAVERLVAVMKDFEDQNRKD